MTHQNHNLTSLPTEQEELARKLLEAPTVFDDMLPEPIQVSIVTFVEEDVMVGNVKMRRRRPTARIAEIGTYVPMLVLNKMMKSQTKIKQLQDLRANSGDTDVQTETMQWMAEQVCEVWKLSEPEMTPQKLMEGLDFKKILGLFNIFFGNLLQGMNK